MTARTLASIAFIVALPVPVAAQPRPVTPVDYGKWESLGAAALAPDGAWLAYGVNRVNEENELRVRGLERDTTLVVKYGSAPAFSADGRWLAYQIGVGPKERERLEEADEPVRNDAGILDLTTLESIELNDISEFSFSPDGRFLALYGYAPADGNTAPLIVRDLARATTTTFGDVSAFAWADQGALLAFTVRTANDAGNGVQVYDAGTGTIHVLDSSTDRYRALAWREAAADLAVLRTRVDSGFADTTHVVLAWRGVGERAQRSELDPASVRGLTADVRIAEHFTPEWSEDGSTIFIGLRPRERSEARDSSTVVADSANGSAPSGGGAADSAEDVIRSDVQVWHARDVRIIPMQKAQEEDDLERTLLAAWHPAESRVVRIGTDLLEEATVLRGDRWAVETDHKPYAFNRMFGRDTRDVWLVDVRTGERRLALQNVRWYHGPSAGGEYLLWFDGEDYWSYHVASGRRTNLTANVEADFANRDYDYPVDRLPARGIAGWVEEDAALLAYDEFNVWRIAPDGSGGERLTDGAAEGVIHRYRVLGDDDDGIDLDEPLHLTVFGKTTKRSGIARLDDGRIERLVWEDARLQRLIRADSADVFFAYTTERFDDSPDWFVARGDFDDAVQVSHTNPFQSDYAWGRSELVDFTSTAGKPLQAVLLYPAGYDASRRYPMIVYTYERLSDNLHNYVVPSERNYYNFNVFTANGYFVLMPDIVYRGRDPGISALEAVVPAVQTVIDRGLVDPDRIGLIGHSWGGYQATYLPTRTDIFAASVAGAPITNFLSFAGAIHWRPGNPEFDHWETGQARMGVPPWEDFEAYLRNSPIHRVHELETPMLMMFGDADGTVDWHQGIEFYNFARRAGKENFVLLVYPGEDHGLRKKENQIDYHRRILQWFGHWLKGEPAPEWMTRGVTWLERKKALESGR